jgi:hypothetical protein
MPTREVSSITILSLSLIKLISKKVLTVSFVVFIATCQFSSTSFAEPVFCYCGKPISGTQKVFIYTTEGEEKYCCPHCGLSAFSRLKDRVKEVRVGDYNTGKLINAEEAYFVENYFTESPCCKGTWIAFAERQEARKFIFKGGGRIVDLQGAMILGQKSVPFQNKPWIYLGIAGLCLAIYFFIRGRLQEKKRKSKLIARFALVFIITFSLITALAVLWKPQNFDHRVLRLTLDEDGNHTVEGELEEIVLKQNGSNGEYDIGFHFFNIIEGESPKDVHIRLLNPSGVDYTYCGLDGKKFDHDTDTRLNLGLGHSFNIDILLKVHQEEYIGGFVFSDKRSGEVYVTIPVYVIQA